MSSEHLSYVNMFVSRGGVNGSFSHFSRFIFVKVFTLSDITIFASTHLNFAVCF